MNKLVAILIGCLVLLGAYLLINFRDLSNNSLSLWTSSPEPFSDWKEFTSQSERFKVSLPSDPRYAKDNVQIPNSDKSRHYEIYVAEKVDGTLFMISIITYPSEVDTSEPHGILRSVIDELMLSRPNNRINDMNRQLFRSHQSFNFNFENDLYKIQGETFIVDRTVYVLSYTARKEDFNLKEYQHFVDSFELLPKSEK